MEWTCLRSRAKQLSNECYQMMLCGNFCKNAFNIIIICETSYG